MNEFPMIIALEDLKMHMDEWELTGYRMLNREPNIAAVVMDGEKLIASYLKYKDGWARQPLAESLKDG